MREVLNRPEDLADVEIRNALDQHWGLLPEHLAYEPVGFGSHHWMTDEHFVSVDRAEGTVMLEAALRTAAALRDDAGLTFVIAPILTDSGALLAAVSDEWVMHVYHRLTVLDSTKHGPHPEPDAVELIREIHAATPVTARHARTEDFSIQHRAGLEAALGDLDGPWDAGPYGERTRALVSAHAEGLERLLAAHDRLVAEVSPEGWVVTHGEPHRGNVFRTTQGWAVVDWDTALVAPPARDLWDLPVDCDERLRALYRLRWDLAEVAGYVTGFREPHTGDRNDDQAWAGLLTYVDAEARWPSLV